MLITRVEKQFIFAMSDAPTESCHASTVTKTADGGLCAAWFGGTKESDSNVRIWTAVRENGVWSAPRKVESGENVAHWNPVLYTRENGEILLFYKVGEIIPEWRTYFCVSKDGGKSFGESRELVKGDVGGRGPVKNKPIKLSDGTLLAPASTETPELWSCFIDVSCDDGLTFTKAAVPVPVENNFAKRLTMIQPTLWESKVGCVHALCRTNRGFAYRTDSSDFGRSWCEPYITPVPNNNSGLDLTRLDNGTLALVSNPTARARTPLTLSFSDNNGVTFSHALTLEDTEGEYSYPAIIADGSTLYITYTYQRKSIAFVTVELAED